MLHDMSKLPEDLQKKNDKGIQLPSHEWRLQSKYIVKKLKTKFCDFEIWKVTTNTCLQKRGATNFYLDLIYHECSICQMFTHLACWISKQNSNQVEFTFLK